jgi:RNA polymerase sigma-70 factor (ECF subfamily)
LEDHSWLIVDEWMRQYSNKIMRVVYLIVGDYYLAEEITQEVFVKAYNSLNTFRGEASAYTWLYRIAINHSKNQLRRKNRVRFLPLSLEEDTEDIISEPLEEKVLKVSLGETIKTCIQELPLKYREAIILYYFEDMKVKDIAQVLRQPEGTVKSKLSRGRELLEAIMRKEGLEYGRERSF